MSWMLLWKIVLLLAVGGFSLMAIIVTVGGASDLRKLFRRLRDSKPE